MALNIQPQIRESGNNGEDYLFECLENQLGSEAYQFLLNLEDQGVVGCLNFRTEDGEFGLQGELSMRFADRQLIISLPVLEYDRRMMGIDFGDWRAIEHNLEITGRSFADLGFDIYSDKGYEHYISTEPYNPSSFHTLENGMIEGGSVVMDSQFSVEFARNLAQFIKLLHPEAMVVIRPNSEEKYEMYARMINRKKINDYRNSQAIKLGLEEAIPIQLQLPEGAEKPASLTEA